jgi:hypothetical protein
MVTRTLTSPTPIRSIICRALEFANSNSSATSRQPRRRRRAGRTWCGGRRGQRWLGRRRGRRQRRRVRSAHVGNRHTARFAGQAFCTVEDATAAVTDDAAVLNHRALADERGAPVVRHAANTWYAAGAADHAARTRSTIERASTSIANAFAIRCADRLARHVLAGSRVAHSAATVGKPGTAAGKTGHPAWGTIQIFERTIIADAAAILSADRIASHASAIHGWLGVNVSDAIVVAVCSARSIARRDVGIDRASRIAIAGRTVAPLGGRVAVDAGDGAQLAGTDESRADDRLQGAFPYHGR